MRVNILEAKNHLSRLIKAALDGEEVIIANRGEPVARLVPAGARRAEEGRAQSGQTGNAGAILDWLQANPLPPYARRSAKDIDAMIAAERTSWD